MEEQRLRTSGGRIDLGLTFVGARSTIQVHIRWRHILTDAVQTLGGTELAYVYEDTMDDTFQVRVSFSLPLDSVGSRCKYIAVIGKKCPTLIEAESEASAAALQHLQHGHLRMLVKDVSRTRCVELEKMCYDVLANASEAYDGIKSLLSKWEADMDKAEMCYSPMCHTVGQSIFHGTNKTNGDIRANIADHLAELTRAYYVKLEELTFEAEGVKYFIEHVRERVKDFFYEPSLRQANEYRGNLPQEIELRMKLVLEEMMIYIGWKWPCFNVIFSEMGLYSCETTLSPMHLHATPRTQALTITGPEASSKEEAIENSCKAAISMLEMDKSMCLVDLNYNHRSHGELYVVEAKQAIDSAIVVGSKVLTEWKAMIDEIHTCKENCQNLKAEHIEEEQARLMYWMKCNTIKAVSWLHEACLADLQLAKRQFNNIAA